MFGDGRNADLPVVDLKFTLKALSGILGGTGGEIFHGGLLMLNVQTDGPHSRPSVCTPHSSDSSLRAASSDEAGFCPVTSVPSTTTKDAQSSPF